MRKTRKAVEILGMKPSSIAGVIEAGLALGIAFGVPGLTQHTVGLIMACVTAGLGVAVAFMVHDPTMSGIVGLCKAVLALGVGYGLTLTDVQTGAIIAFITVVGGLFLHTQVSPKLGNNGKHVKASQ